MLCKVSALINCFKTFCIEIVFVYFFNVEFLKPALLHTLYLSIYTEIILLSVCVEVWSPPPPGRH